MTTTVVVKKFFYHTQLLRSFEVPQTHLLEGMLKWHLLGLGSIENICWGAIVSATTFSSRAPNSGRVCPRSSELTPGYPVAPKSTWNQFYVLGVIKHIDPTNTRFQHFLEAECANGLKSKIESGCVTLGKVISVFFSKIAGGIRWFHIVRILVINVRNPIQDGLSQKEDLLVPGAKKDTREELTESKAVGTKPSGIRTKI